MSEGMYGRDGYDNGEDLSEAWATEQQMRAFSSGDVTHDIILGHGASLSFSDALAWNRSRNNNVAVIGGSGSGKTRSFVFPNLINHQANYVITDTKKELWRATHEGFEKDGYEVLRLDTIDLLQSCRFDPLHYVSDEEDINPIVKMILDGISPDRSSPGRSGDLFWEEAAELLMRALVGILLELERSDGALRHGGVKGKRYKYLSMSHLLELFDLLSVTSTKDEIGGVSCCPLGNLVNIIAGGTMSGPMSYLTVKLRAQPTCYAVRQFQDFSIAANRTLASIAISLNAHLSRLKTRACMRVFSDDDMRLDDIDMGKRVIYLVMSDNESATTFLGRMAFKLLLNRVLKKADACPSGKLARPVVFMCDEFPNLGPLPDFERVISIVRSRGISFSLCMQSISQLNYVYGKERATIILDNCDALVYMGAGSSYESAEYISNLCGTTRAGTRQEHKLMSSSDVSRMSRTDCIVKISGAKPYLTVKYDVAKHPNAVRYLKLVR